MEQSICPLRWGNAVGNSAKCVGKMCAWYCNEKCAIAIIANAIAHNEEDG